MNIQDFYAGREFFAHTWLGAHIEGDGVAFRTFAPAAEGIVVHSPKGDWEMRRIEDGNFWEAHVAGLVPGDPYEYRIYHGGTFVDHADPYGYGMDLRPNHRSIVRDLSFSWTDDEWMATRTPGYDQPVNIYELHLGSWRKRSGDQATSNVEDWYTYAQIADDLVSYLKRTGYTHVEFLPLMEHPLDASWGYQPTGFFAPTSRYGTPQQLMELIDKLHRAGIGAILDFVPVHFAADEYGLANYDGTPLFEYPNDAVGVSEWGSHNFMHSRGETCSFLQSSVNYWLGAYHFDGIRMDAISRIIYWQGDESRGVNANAVDFVRSMNGGLKNLNQGIMLIAEDSTSYAGTTTPAHEGGLGFDYKWDMGWMHDTLELFQTGPEYRSDHYHKLSFSMMYFANERYLMPLSHDEVVHGKATVAQKMWGDYGLKFPQARTLYLYMAAHPGKMLNFMGSEIAQLREWDEDREQDWFLRQYPLHDSFYTYCAELNETYRQHPALWAADYDKDGFVWRQVSGEKDVVYAFERRGAGERMLCVLNLSDAEHRDYSLGLPGSTRAKLVLDTDWDRYGGSTPVGSRRWRKLANERIELTLPPFSGQLLLLD